MFSHYFPAIMCFVHHSNAGKVVKIQQFRLWYARADWYIKTIKNCRGAKKQRYAYVSVCEILNLFYISNTHKDTNVFYFMDTR